MSPGVRDWIGKMMLRSSGQIRAITRIPVLGGIVRRVGGRIMPADRYVWAQVSHGPGEGLWLEFNPRVGSSYFDGAVEPSVQDALVKHLRAGMTFYDLGANIGFFSLLAARLVGNSGRVFSFEPDAQVAARLRRNVEKNGFSNVTCVQAGVWSSSGLVDFLESDSASPDRGTGRFTLTHSQQASVPTRCVSLDDFVKTEPAPSAIKCDVEGAEIEVLRGASNVFRTHRPWFIAELHSKEACEEAPRLLTAYGYSLIDIDDRHVMAS